MADQVTDARRMPFRILYDRVIDEWGTHIGPDGLAVYWALARFANSSTGDAWPSAATIGKKVGMSRRKAVDVLHLLADWGLIQITPRQEQGQKSNVYTMLDLDGVQPVHTPYAQRAYPPMQDMHPPYAPRASERDISNKNQLNKRETAPALSITSSTDDPHTVAYVPDTPYPVTANRTTGQVHSPAPEPVAPPARVPGQKLVPGGPGLPPVTGRKVPETACPDIFPVTPAMQAWARENTPTLISQLPTLTRLFVSYYTAGKGAGTLARNWEGMWQTWMLRQISEYSGRGTASPPPTVSRVVTGPRVVAG